MERDAICAEKSKGVSKNKQAEKRKTGTESGGSFNGSFTM
jgi:hypothetical protein